MGMKNNYLAWPPRSTQLAAIERLKCEIAELGGYVDTPHEPANRREARDLIYKLRETRNTLRREG